MTLDFPPIYLLPTHIEPNKLPELESKIPTLTHNIDESNIILGKISNKERAKFELRRRDILTEDIKLSSIPPLTPETQKDDPSPPPKRRKLSGSVSSKHTHDYRQITGSEEESLDDSASTFGRTSWEDQGFGKTTDEDDNSIVRVVKFSWFMDCLAQDSILPIDKYLIYEGRRIQKTSKKPPPNSDDILRRARQEGGDDSFLSKGGSSHIYASTSQHFRTSANVKRPELVHESTSEHERRSHMPPIPDYLHTTYSCQRPTPASPPNDSFIDELEKIRTFRTLEGDKVGIRAYSTSIASLSAYPYLISHSAEVARLPGCSDKIAALYQQWKANGYLEEIEEAKKDPKMSALQLFYNIWGVADTTAREFYKKGWRDLDDIVEYGWDNLSRVQQIGIKYYDELQEKLPRREVEEIGQVILNHANKIRKGFEMVIVGGYRRGKRESGDVDVILSHPNAVATLNFVAAIVHSLEKDKYITHTLIMSTKNSDRGQTPVSWKGQDRKAGAGFDTLDKALVVWQDPYWDKTASSKNPNPHRRVDIIISPWKTAGCAVIGWTGGTTFQRDLRRYCKHVKALKFDSSGVRSWMDGSWVDLESDLNGPAPDMLTAEKRVFERLGLEWRPPEERCTR
ncbi:DNA polymerase type-X family protein pol4 [Daldinia childiae]|uniref:DNA polymerase type-X family protein pol4 n=1 Tax=Daldinia childiae TaxID=326645 RepID=UPI001446AC8B|nr:DNA polymerase type-X family protein pol4 [Daldinia childiae]KAF3062392.1 DNA polymerase type-X family protein pol4 [Daldinia childiae]